MTLFRDWQRWTATTSAAVYLITPEGWAINREHRLRDLRYRLRRRSPDEEIVEWIRWEDSRLFSEARRRRDK